MFKIQPKSGCLETEIRLELLLICIFHLALIRISAIHKNTFFLKSLFRGLSKTILFIHCRKNIGIRVIFKLKWFFFNKIEHSYVKHCDLFFCYVYIKHFSLNFEYILHMLSTKCTLNSLFNPVLF
jgi:hypothetical protein